MCYIVKDIEQRECDGSGETMMDRAAGGQHDQLDQTVKMITVVNK